MFLAPDDRLPHVLAFSCLYVDGEALVTELDRLGFAVASGSACTASTLEPSHVLAAMGALTHGNVRVSLGRDTVAGRRAPARRGAAGRHRAAARRVRGRPMSDPGTDLELDCRGMGCPRPVIELAKALRGRRGGRARWPSIADDAAAGVDVQAWCRMRGQEYAGSEIAPDGVPSYLVRRLS